MRSLDEIEVQLDDLTETATKDERAAMRPALISVRLVSSCSRARSREASPISSCRCARTRPRQAWIVASTTSAIASRKISTLISSSRRAVRSDAVSTPAPKPRISGWEKFRDTVPEVSSRPASGLDQRSASSPPV